MSFTKTPGQSGTLTAVFTDSQGNSDPLGSLPVATEKNNLLTLSPVGTPTVNDPTFSWTFSVPSTLAVGTALEIDITAEGDPTPGKDTITGSILGTVVQAEDTQVALTVS